tara:strand:- start:547 stop:753 length:207 start_codon:yes stop_codon:yes gene_type:complete
MKDKIENNVAEIIFGILILICLTSCGMMNKLSDEQLQQRNKIDYEMNKLYNEYQVKNDSLLIEYYKIK